MTPCLIALGSNVDASVARFERAMMRLDQLGLHGGRLSPCCTTNPVGPNAGSVFLNAAATGFWPGTAFDLLSVLHRVEAEAGRTRGIHWGPRTLDLDLLLFGDEVHAAPELTVPHPAMWYRRFVLEPAVAVAAEMVHPGLNDSVAMLFQRLMQRPLRLRVDTSVMFDDELRIGLLLRLGTRFPDIDWTGTAGDQHIAATIQLTAHDHDASRNERVIWLRVADLDDAEIQLAGLAAAILG